MGAIDEGPRTPNNRVLAPQIQSKLEYLGPKTYCLGPWTVRVFSENIHGSMLQIVNLKLPLNLPGFSRE